MVRILSRYCRNTLSIVIDGTPISTFCFKGNLSENHLSYMNQWYPIFLALDVGVIISQAQPCTSIRGCHATFLVKNTLFKGEVAWQPLKELQCCSPSILIPPTKVQIFLWITRKSNFFSNPAREHVFKLLLIHLNTHSVECSCFWPLLRQTEMNPAKGMQRIWFKS